MKNKKIILALITFGILLIAFVLGSKVYKGQQKDKMSFLAKENASLFVPEYAARKGAENPEVYLVEFLDPECESCRQFHPLVKSIMNEFEGRVQLIVRYAPFHHNSIFVIKVLEASRKQEKYWEVLEVLFQTQPEWGSHHNPRPDLVWNYLPRVGVDIDKLKLDMEDPKIMEIISQDKKDGEALGVRGTPSFFVNGKPLENFGYQQLRDMVAQELQGE